MLSTYRKTIALLSPEERREGAIVLVLVILMAVVDIAGVTSVMPFLSVLGNPDIVQSNEILASLYQRFDFQTTDAFLAALGIAASAVILISAAVRAFTTFRLNRFIEMRRHDLSARLLETYLRQPYAFFLNRHSADMAKSILSEVDRLVSGALRPGVLMVAYSVVALAFTILLLAIDPILAISVAIIVGGVYLIIFLSLDGILRRVGLERAKANRERFTAAGEALSGIKDIKLLGREHSYLARFRIPSSTQARHLATNQTLSELPSFIIEAVAFGGMIAITLVLLSAGGGATSSGALGDVLPLLGLYAFAGYRLLPAARAIYRGFAQMSFGAAAVDLVYDDLSQRMALAEINVAAKQPLIPRDTVALQNVSFSYPNTSASALKDINLTIPVGSSLGLVGSTGAGKTTLVDVVLGLLRPTSGAITVDGEAVSDKELRAWQRALGYVPQDIFLADASVADNIALGVPAEQVNNDQVVRCARMAQVHDFIVNELADGYDTFVGERGVRLSGGQRQRIGIARALYHEPSVLVFDEATSALDTVTERAVMEAIESLHEQKTIILVAHRLSTVRGCDKVVLLEEGQIAEVGKFSELQQRSARFRSMAGEM